MRGLILKKEWADLIMMGLKTIEVRGRNTNIIDEDFYILESGTRRVRGTVKVSGVEKLFDEKQVSRTEVEKYAKEWEKKMGGHRVFCGYRELRELYIKTPYLWQLADIRPIKEEVYYRHPAGAQIWVKDVEIIQKGEKGKNGEN